MLKIKNNRFKKKDKKGNINKQNLRIKQKLKKVIDNGVSLDFGKKINLGKDIDVGKELNLGKELEY